MWKQGAGIRGTNAISPEYLISAGTGGGSNPVAQIYTRASAATGLSARVPLHAILRGGSTNPLRIPTLTRWICLARCNVRMAALDEIATFFHALAKRRPGWIPGTPSPIAALPHAAQSLSQLCPGSGRRRRDDFAISYLEGVPPV
jgi:hypothetical protein